jgi:GMP synthase-like glutamine amidotransferase
MKPIAILQHERCRGPEPLQGVLARRGLVHRLFQVAEGEGMPRSCRDFSGIVLLGSCRSARDAMPWIDAEMALVRQSLACEVPLFAQGIGAHLMARALGASPPVPSRGVPPGWMRAHVTPWGRRWLGPIETLEVFGWHCEAMALPKGAQRLLFGEHCQNLGFALGRHVALQCQLDVSSEALHDWAGRGKSETLRRSSLPVPSAQQILLNSADRVARLRPALVHLFDHWIDGLTVGASQPAVQAMGGTQRQARAA